MADITSYETFLFYQARSREEQKRREAAAEHIRKINALLGYMTDLIEEVDESE